MAAWNPSAPNSIGLEWRPTTDSVVPLTTTTDCVAWLVDSTVTETITGVYVPHTWTGPTAGYGKLLVDVYDLSDTGAGDTPSTTRYAPNEDISIGNLYAPTVGSWGSTLSLGNGRTKIDDGSSHNDSDWLAFPGGSHLRMAFGTAAFTGRPTSVSFDVRVFGYAGQNGKLHVELYNGSTYVQRLGTITPPANGADWPSGFSTYRLGPFTTNPLTGLPWTASDITSFDTGTNLLVQLTGPVSSTAVSWLSMIVESGTDKRVATGSCTVQTSPPSGTQTNLVVTFASNWSKVSGRDYLLIARRIDDPAGAAQPLIPQPIYLAGDPSPYGQGVWYSSTIESSGLLYELGEADSDRTVPYWLARNDGAMSADSHPYHDLDAWPISWNYSAGQVVTDASVQTYRRVRTLLGVKSSAAPTQPLSIGLRDTLFSGLYEPFTGTAASWPAQWIDTSGTAGAGGSIVSSQGRIVTGTASFGYWRARANYSLAASFMAYGKVTFRSVAAANSARVFFAGGTTWTGGVLDSSYELRMNAVTNTAELFRIDGTGGVTQLTGAGYTFTVDVQYDWRILRFGVDGFIGVKVWPSLNTEPAGYTFMWVDDTYTGTGFGLGAVGAVDTTSDTVDLDEIAVWPMQAVGRYTVDDLGGTDAPAILTDAAGITWYDAVATLDAGVTLATSTLYTLELASCQNPASPWRVAVLDATASHSLTGNITFAGTSAASGVGRTNADVAITIGSVPTTPSAITATKTTTTINGATIDYVAVSWTTGGALGSSFARWELERSEDAGTTWARIATISTEATVAFDDYQGARGVAAKYRVRVVRTDGAPSDWRTLSGTVTPAAYPGSWAVFTSNAAPELTVGYTPDGTLLVPEFLSADETEFVPLHDEDYQASFAPLEERGVRMAFRLQVHTSSATPSGGHGVRVFDALRAVARVPGALCLHTADGERFLGTLQVQRGPRDFATGWYFAEVVFTETTGDAATVAL